MRSPTINILIHLVNIFSNPENRIDIIGKVKVFEIKVKGKVLDYRITKQLDLKKVEEFFSQNYVVKKIWQQGRHVLGILQKDGTSVFLKLAATKGIGAVTEIEYNWNHQFNDIVSRKTNFWVPQNIEKGLYNGLFFMITEYFDEPLFAKRPHKGKVQQILKDDLEKIIKFSEVIQNLDIDPLSQKDNEDYNEWFLEKTKSWLEAVPKEVIEEYKVSDVFKIVENGYKLLERKTRHGDFTPWHMIRLREGQIGLIDGEHAMRNGVQYYDIGYLIQRIFTVMENPKLAKDILNELLKRNYNLEKLKIILAARAIGGFCDEALMGGHKNYAHAHKFQAWVLGL